MKKGQIGAPKGRSTEAQTGHQESSAGAKGVALTPPVSGISIPDHPLVQRMDGARSNETSAQSENKTGLPDRLKAGVERLSGLAMDDVRVHYNSTKPAQLQAFAYTQGAEIHVAPGQERYLPHEAWHVVQQKQGRVKSTVLAYGAALNADQAKEAEAERMGAEALTMTAQQVANYAVLPRQQTVSTNVIQAKQYFNPNHRSLALPGSQAENYRDYVINTVIQGALALLPDNATLPMAIAAINYAAQTDHIMPAQNLTFDWVGATVYLQDSQTHTRLDLLGAVQDDQNQNLYLAVPTGTASPLQVNMASGEERVLDSAGRYIPRQVYRSITVPERTALYGRNDLLPRVPNAGLNPLEHVAGGQNSQYSSYTRSQADVMNSHGAFFNAAGTGRVRIDLLQVAQADILDLSNHAGIDYHLRPYLPQNARANFNPISANAGLKAQQELANGIIATAGTTNPHRAELTDQRWQALVDAYRTQEVLVQGHVPFAAVTNFGEFTAPQNPLSLLAQQGIAANQATTVQHSQTGQTALANYRQSVHILPPLWQQDVTRVITQLRSKKEEYLFKHRASGVANARQRNRVFRDTLEAEFAAVVGEVHRVAQAMQSRALDNWANVDQNALRTELTNRFPGWNNRLRTIRP